MALIKKFRIKSFKKKQPVLKIEKVSLSFKKRQILENISFTLNQGEILGLLGPNGVGKSTIFNLIIGLLKPDFGNIIINNKNVLEYPIADRSSKFNFTKSQAILWSKNLIFTLFSKSVFKVMLLYRALPETILIMLPSIKII